MTIFQNLSKPFIVFVERFYPNPFVFVVLLTFVTFGLVFGMTDTTPLEAINAWGSGLPKLLTFMAQLSITLITSYALAHTDQAQKGLAALARIPKTNYQAYFLVTLISSFANLIAWSLGLIVGAIIARQVAIEADKKGMTVHYPLLVASAYAGFVLWHMGYSSSAALFVATPDHALEAQMGILPVTETIFSSFNMIIAGITLVAICLVCPLMEPKKEAILSVKAKTLLPKKNHIQESTEDKKTLGRILDNSRWVTLSFGLLLTVFLIKWFAEKGLNLDLNIVNWTFLALGLILAKNVKHFISLIQDAGKTVGPILLQYPFYAGIMGLLMGTGLVEILSNWFTEVATADTLSFFAFLSGGIVNMFVPSGGGQWVIQGPIFIEAAQALNVDPAVIVMGVAYGDQWTNMIQPFWTIPLLAIAGLDMRKIMGYTFVILLITLITFGGGLLILGAG